jgi:hypothetical protein
MPKTAKSESDDRGGSSERRRSSKRIKKEEIEVAQRSNHRSVKPTSSLASQADDKLKVVSIN